MANGSEPRDHRGRPIEFGRTADDYDRHRPGFPDSFFDKLVQRAWIARGQRALDVGAGSGVRPDEAAHGAGRRER